MGAVHIKTALADAEHTLLLCGGLWGLEKLLKLFHNIIIYIYQISQNIPKIPKNGIKNNVDILLFLYKKKKNNVKNSRIFGI